MRYSFSGSVLMRPAPWVRSGWLQANIWIKYYGATLKNQDSVWPMVSNCQKLQITLMPPKNKKDAEEEAKRLEEQRKKKEQEEALFALERQKYAPQTLPTGLFLPASAQLIIDFPRKPLSFVQEKLRQALAEAHPGALESPRLPFLMKELHFYIKDSIEVFGSDGDASRMLPHRILVGTMLSTLLNGGAEGKKREDDEKHLKRLVIEHCDEKNGRLLSREEGLKVLKYAGEKYFGRFQLITMFDRFNKQQKEQGFSLYLQTPTLYFNERETIFVDLSEKPEQKPSGQELKDAQQ